MGTKQRLCDLLANARIPPIINPKINIAFLAVLIQPTDSTLEIKMNTTNDTRPQFRVTFDTVTFESAENGLAERSGFVDPAGYEYTRDNFATWKDWQEFTPPEMSLREALNIHGGPFEDSGRWFSTVDGCHNYRTGEETRYSIHPPANITPASYERLAKLLKAYR